MVQPVTGPFTSVSERLGPSNSTGVRTKWYTSRKSGYKQKKPYNLHLYFTWDVEETLSLASTDPSSTVSLSQHYCNSNWVTIVSGASTSSFNKAYGRFIGNLKPAQAELAAAIAEWNQSLGMIGKRATQLARFTNSIRRLRFGEAAQALGVRKLKTHKSKTVADAILEYRFGWAPLIGDVSNAVKTLTGGIPPVVVRGKGKVEGSGHLFVSADVNQPCDWVVESAHHISAFVRVTNPNLALANQLGLLNPAYVAWEVTPWSFVLDYFVNVGDYLNGFTDLLGYEVSDPTWTWRAKAASSQSLSWGTTIQPGHASWSGRKFTLQRTVNTPLPGPSLQVRWPWKLSPQRAATSVSLLLQQLHRIKR